MPPLNWNIFEHLSGSAQYNFEMLCRGVVWRNYARFGRFMALANQPGVEFHIKLDSACTLGNAGRWYGWQCRWYTIPSGTSLGTARRGQIEKALRTTEKVLPDLTDWVLWTRHPLTEGDQKWFHKLKTKKKLHLWASAEIAGLITGDAEILRSTYFGDLVFTPNTLATLHGTTVSRVQARWLREAHQPVETERILRRMLAESQSWQELSTVAVRLAAAEKSIFAILITQKKSLLQATKAFCAAATYVGGMLGDISTLLRNGDLDLLCQRLNQRPVWASPNIIALPRLLRAARQTSGLIATNILADMRLADRLLDEINKLLRTRLVAVLADAGGGKTQMSAQLTASENDRPAGILIYGQDLHAGQGLDDLARKIVIPGNGTPIPTMEALVAAIDAAGQRAQRRLPIVIDGLNEAEDPRDWKGPLASLNEILRRYPYVLVVCTLRTGSRRPRKDPWKRPEAVTPRSTFADEALPDGVERLEIRSFGEDTLKAIQRYFAFYKINSGDADLPFELLSHPLTLRLFCEVSNPKREKEVGVEAMPGSLTGLFERYLSQAADRIAQLSPLNRRYYPPDVMKALDEIGAMLWELQAREIGQDELRRRLSDETRPWNESMVRALEQEGVMLRIHGEALGVINVMAIYDALGGFLIARSLLRKHGRDGFETWLKNPATLSVLTGAPEAEDENSNPPAKVIRHPLATDILRALVGLMPRTFNQQLWQIAPVELRADALRRTVLLEGNYLDAATVTELATIAIQTQPDQRDIIGRFYQTRGSHDHPLNANFLDSVLRPMGVADRDLRWTEWVRRNQKEIMYDFRDLEQRWQGRPIGAQTPSDLLRARWVMWMLTSTVNGLRDLATRTLYWFGRSDPAALFDLTLDALGINDIYVTERMLAASYGVVMARHVGLADTLFLAKVLPEFARRLYEATFKENAPHSTTHALMRDYARRVIQIALLHKPKLLSKGEKTRMCPPFKDGGLRDWKEAEWQHGEGRPFHGDFENYTLGRLVPERNNYDFDHPEYQKLRRQVLWCAQQFGWSAQKFEEVDKMIAREDRSPRSGGEEKKTERYGKKYSNIAYLELLGFRQDEGKLDRNEDNGRPFDVDIDPSFPMPQPECNVISDNFLGNPRTKVENWILNGGVPNLTPYLQMTEVAGQKGPWVLIDGFLAQQNERLERRLFCFIRSFLVGVNDAPEFYKCLSEQNLGGRWLPEKPSFIYTFAGEIPWCETFPQNDNTVLNFVTQEDRVIVKRRRPQAFLDGKRIGLTTFELQRILRGNFVIFGPQHGLSEEDLKRLEIRYATVDEEEIRRKTKRLKALIPVTDFGWEGRTFEGAKVRAAVLAKNISHGLKLTGRPQTFDLFTQDGERATLGFSDKPQDYNNSQTFLFVRKDLLKAFLKKEKLALIWAIWGEREYSSNVARSWSAGGDRPEVPYKVFQTVIPAAWK